MSKKTEDNFPRQLRVLHDALISIVSAMNRPQRDAALIKAAGIHLDRALFPLLIVIERLGPIAVGDLADRVGRGYTTVSRQVTKLESLRLVKSQASASDGRVREAVISPKGKAMTEMVDAAREKVGRAIFSSWNPRDFDELVRLLRRFADELKKP